MTAFSVLVAGWLRVQERRGIYFGWVIKVSGLFSPKQSEVSCLEYTTNKMFCFVLFFSVSK